MSPLALLLRRPAPFAPAAGSGPVLLLLAGLAWGLAQPAHAQFVKAIGNARDDYGTGVAADGFGNVFVTGHFKSSDVDFDREHALPYDNLPAPLGTMGWEDAFVARYDATGLLQWVKAIGGTGRDMLNAVAVDGEGNVIVTGYIASVDVDFDREHVVPGDTLDAYYGSDIALAKYDGDGLLLWAKVMGRGGLEEGNSLAVDASDNIYVAGYFDSMDLDFDPAHVVDNDTRSTRGGADGFVAKYDPAGTLQWVKTFGSSTAPDDATGVAVDGDGNVYATGTILNLSGGSVDFDQDHAVDGDTRVASARDAYLAKYNSSGVLQYVKLLGGSSNDAGVDVAVDVVGYVYVLGTIRSANVDFDPEHVVAGDTKSAGSSQDLFLARYDGAGVLQYVKTPRGPQEDHTSDLAVDPAGNAYITGYFVAYSTPMDFDPDAVTSGDSKTCFGGEDVYLVKYASTGALQYVRTINGAGHDRGLAVAVDAEERVYAAGIFKSVDADFDPAHSYADGRDVRSALGLDDAYVLMLTAATAIPVELSAFRARARGRAVRLEWETAAETGNEGFEVEHRGGDGWRTLAFVPGAGTSIRAHAYAYETPPLEPGPHRFRLKQVDYDGAFEYSPEVEAAVELSERFVLEPGYPNPFNPRATIRFAVKEPVPVEVRLYNVLGQPVRLLYRGTPEPGRMQAVVLDGSGLPPGTYLVRMTGEGIEAVERLVLVR